MSDETVTKLAKKRGRPLKYTDAQAKLAYELYVEQGLTGDAVARALNIPRTSVVDLAQSYAQEIKEGDASDTSAPPADLGADESTPSDSTPVPTDPIRRRA